MFCHFTEYFGGQFYNYIDDIDYMNVKITFFFQDRFHDKLKKGKMFEILNKLVINKSEVSTSLTEFTICNNKEI